MLTSINYNLLGNDLRSAGKIKIANIQNLGIDLAESLWNTATTLKRVYTESNIWYIIYTCQHIKYIKHFEINCTV